MKRILFILALAVMVGGCWDRGDVTSKDSLFAQRYTYEGHQYILFIEGLGSDAHGGVVHDPDCPCHYQVAQTLSEWDKMILAISYTESRWNPDALGKAGDSGHLQLTKPYLAEINRIYKTNYTLEDAFDPETAIKLFTMMQEHYNKEHDIQNAIYHHNKSGYYRDAEKDKREELTEFEKACMELYNEGRDDGFSGYKLSNEAVKESASELLALVRGNNVRVKGGIGAILVLAKEDK